jgi:hypothetical protein
MLGKTIEYFDYSTKEAREQHIPQLFILAQNARRPVEELWNTFDNVYDGIHKKSADIKEKIDDDAKLQAMFEPVLTDPFIHIESQINPRIPEAEFYPRDQYGDYETAKKRKYVVDYIIAINDLESKNTDNERRMRKYGDSFIKCCFDEQFNGGDIRATFINNDDFFPDPSATNIKECEYIDYVYYMHIQKIKRVYGADIKKAGLEIDDIIPTTQADTRTVSKNTVTNADDFMVQVLEHWYKDEDGDVACSILINEKEIKHIPKYYENTKDQNKDFPFEQFYRIGDERSFWNTSELKAILPLMFQIDKVMAIALENMDLMSNDIWLVEEGSVEEDISNAPGAIVFYKQGRLPPKRAGGIASLQNAIATIQFLQGEIQRTVRNYDSNTGKETQRVTTASGLAQLRADASQQSTIKDFDRLQAWKRVFLLIDRLALEFYDEDKHIFIGVPDAQIAQKYQANPMQGENIDPKRGNISFTYNSTQMAQKGGNVAGLNADGTNRYYYPLVDCDIKASNGFEKSKSFTLQALQSILMTPVDANNYKIATMIVEMLDIPNSEEIIDMWKNKFDNPIQIPVQIQEHVQSLPPQQQELLLKTFQENPNVLIQLMAEQMSGQM